MSGQDTFFRSVRCLGNKKFPNILKGCQGIFESVLALMSRLGPFKGVMQIKGPRQNDVLLEMLGEDTLCTLLKVLKATFHRRFVNQRKC